MKVHEVFDIITNSQMIVGACLAPVKTDVCFENEKTATDCTDFTEYTLFLSVKSVKSVVALAVASAPQ